MAGFNTIQEIEDNVNAGKFQTLSYYSLANSGTGTGPFVSYWTTNVRPAPAANPAGTPGVAYTNAGMNFADTGTIRKFLSYITAFSVQTNNAHLMLADRLVGVGGIAMNSTGDKTINSTALPRYTTGESVQVFLEVTTVGSTTAPIVSMSSYTNSAGTPGQVGGTITFPTVNLGLGGMVGPMPLASGDYGVKSVETINVATAGGGSGVVNVILLRYLTEVCVPGTTVGGAEKEWPIPNTHMIRVFDGATLMWIMQNFNANTSASIGQITVIEA
jgi:hypothetical protein